MVLVTVYSPETTFVLQQPHTPARQAAATGTLLLSSASSSVVPTRPKKVCAGCSLVN
jgi:hypothetical protein